MVAPPALGMPCCHLVEGGTRGEGAGENLSGQDAAAVGLPLEPLEREPPDEVPDPEPEFREDDAARVLSGDPVFSDPDFPDFSVPEFPDFSGPVFSDPVFSDPDFPDFSVPDFSDPLFSDPDFSAPDFSDEPESSEEEPLAVARESLR